MPVSAFAFSNNSASVLLVPKTNGSVTVGPVSFPPAVVGVELEVPPHPTNSGKSKRVRPKCFFFFFSYFLMLENEYKKRFSLPVSASVMREL